MFLLSLQDVVLLTAQLLIGGQISSGVNLILTVLFLRFFHHQSTSSVPRRLKHLTFGIIAPAIFYDLKPVNYKNERKDDDQNEASNLEKEGEVERVTREKNVPGDEKNVLEWQMVSKVFDRLLFIINVPL